MLNKRTNILFDDKLWNRLSKLAKAKQISVGNLVRQAAEEKLAAEEILDKRKKAIESTLKLRPAPFKGKIDYKELIDAGRKY